MDRAERTPGRALRRLKNGPTEAAADANWYLLCCTVMHQEGASRRPRPRLPDRRQGRLPDCCAGRRTWNCPELGEGAWTRARAGHRGMRYSIEGRAAYGLSYPMSSCRHRPVRGVSRRMSGVQVTWGTDDRSQCKCFAGAGRDGARTVMLRVKLGRPDDRFPAPPGQLIPAELAAGGGPRHA